MSDALTRPALLLVEFQRQWTDPGLYRRLIGRALDRKDVVATTAALADRARARGIPVVQAPLVIDRKRLRGVFGALTRGLVFGAHSRRSELTPEIFRDGDVVVRGRTSFDAFTGSDLLERLREIDAHTLLIGGFTTDQCVSRTFRTALELGFDARVVPECTATFAGVIQRRSERRVGSRIAPIAALASAF